MLVSDSKKFIYIHTSRTAGRSTKRALSKYASLNITSSHSTPKKNQKFPKGWIVGSHSRPRILKKYLGAKVWDTYFKLVFVRNPYSWAISRWTYEHRKNPAAIKFIRKGGAQAQEVFHKWLVRFKGEYYLPHLENGLIAPGAWMSSYVMDSAGNKMVDFVGRFEQLEKDFSAVCRKIGINASLPHIGGVKGKKHYSVYYTPVTRKLAKSMFVEDLKVFNYRFQSKKNKK